MQACQRLRKSLVIPRQAAEPRAPSKAALHHPTTRQRHEAALRFRELHHLKQDAVHRRLFCGLLARVALVDIGDLNRFARDLLHLLAQLTDLRPILLIGCGDAQRRQMPQRVNRQMPLAAATALRAIVAGAGAALGRGLQRPAVADGCRRLLRSALREAQDRAQIVGEALTGTGFEPSLGLLVDDVPGGKSRGIMRQEAPARTSQRKPLKTSRKG